MKAFSREKLATNWTKIKTSIYMLMASVYTSNANASILGDILSNSTGQGIVKFFFMCWGASLIIDAIGKVLEGSAEAVKKGMQGVLLMVVGWMWPEMIDALGFTKG